MSTFSSIEAEENLGMTVSTYPTFLGCKQALGQSEGCSDTHMRSRKGRIYHTAIVNASKSKLLLLKLQRQRWAQATAQPTVADN